MGTYYLIGLVIFLIVFMWPSFYARKFKFMSYTEEELSNISSKFSDLYKAHRKHRAWQIFISIPCILMSFYMIKHIDVEQFPNIPLAFMLMAISGAAISDGMFTMKHGVIPGNSRSRSRRLYGYDASNGIVKFGRLQVYFYGVVGILALITVVISIILNLY